MSKAFTRENEDQGSSDRDEPESDAELDQLPSRKNYMTPACSQRMRGELKQILTIDRPALTQVVAWAASNGDRSENADYTYGKRKLREMDRRIRFLQKRLESAEIVDPADPSRTGLDRVLFGATVLVRHEEGPCRTYRIVGIDETDIARGHISWISPLAQALLNQRAGEAVLLRTPKGEEELEIVSIRYESF